MGAMASQITSLTIVYSEITYHFVSNLFNLLWQILFELSSKINIIAFLTKQATRKIRHFSKKWIYVNRQRHQM